MDMGRSTFAAQANYNHKHLFKFVIVKQLEIEVILLVLWDYINITAKITTTTIFILILLSICYTSTVNFADLNEIWHGDSLIFEEEHGYSLLRLPTYMQAHSRAKASNVIYFKTNTKE